MAKNTDQVVVKLIEEVTKRKAEIKSLERPSYKTNMAFSEREGELKDTVNLNVESSVAKLVSIAGFILAKELAFETAIEKLGLERIAFRWNGFSSEHWLADIQTRIAKINVSTKRKKLEELEARLDKIISPELKAQMELDSIMAEIDAT